jgi:YfiH family protein
MSKTLQHIEWDFEVEKKGDSSPLFHQVHGTKVIEFLNKSAIEIAKTNPSDADGAFASFPEAELSVYTADCFPLLFFTDDPQGPVAAVHAGWRGLKAGIVTNTLSLFENQSDLHVILGPGIRSCCFTVREDFIKDWDAAGLMPQRFLSESERGIHFDLLAFLLTHELKNLNKNKIHLEHHRCTSCSVPALPSFRRNKSGNPRIRTWIRKKN